MVSLMAAACTQAPEPDPQPGTKEFGVALDACTEQSGKACIWAGATNAFGLNGDDHVRTRTMLYWPIDMAFAPDGTPWILDWNNHKIRKVMPDQTVKTVVGNFLGDGPSDNSDTMEPGAPGKEVNLNHPTDIVFRADGSLLFAAWHNHKIRKVDTATGNVTIVYGKGPGFGGDGGAVADVRFNQPSRIALDSKGAFYIIDQRNFRVRRISADNKVVESFAGNGTKGFSGDAGPAAMAQLEFEAGSNPDPSGAIAVDAQDNVYIADTLNYRVRKVDSSGVITTIVGNGTKGDKGDGGPAINAQITNIKDMEIGPDGRLYLADTDNHRVRAVDLKTGIIDTVAGSGKGSAEVDGVAAKSITLLRPFGIAFDAKGALYISDTFNSRIIKIPQ
jgi:sugar lactone lactonase YvrE